MMIVIVGINIIIDNNQSKLDCGVISSRLNKYFTNNDKPLYTNIDKESVNITKKTSFT